MSNYKIVDNHIELKTFPKKFKKLTATRFATVLGLNAWNTAFSAWCEITKTYEEPFEDSIYTIAGKIIEPKIFEYLKSRYFMDIVSPEDVYGKDYFKKTFGDFFPENDVLGGMWDFKGKSLVVEVKTTQRVEDWRGHDGHPLPPIYYKLQAGLYAYLLGVDDVVMTCSFLSPSDYPIVVEKGKFDTTPTENFEPNIHNTIVINFKMSEDFPTFEESYVKTALNWWNRHVVTGISPDFDEKKDAEILKVLRKNVVENTSDEIQELLNEADVLKHSIDLADKLIEKDKKRLKEIDEKVKKYMNSQFRDGDKKVEIKGKNYMWTLSKSQRKTVDSNALKKDGIYEKYTNITEVLTLKKSSLEA